MTVWRLKAVRGHGWLRGMWSGPIVTAREDEAQEFPTRDAALVALGDREGWLVVEGEARGQVKYGEPTP